MSNSFKQTWWDENLPTQFEQFQSWIGSSEAPSKVFARKYMKDRQIKSIIDLGCGTATEYFAYKEENPSLFYVGLDSSEFLFNKNVAKGITMILSSIENNGLQENFVDVAFARHILEHQPDFRPVMGEMIRLARVFAMHIFFIKPKEGASSFHYDHTSNLYHNQFSKDDIESYVRSNEKVKSFVWQDIGSTEQALIINVI